MNRVQKIVVAALAAAALLLVGAAAAQASVGHSKALGDYDFRDPNKGRPVT
jgi:Spy/CpxP family protein refolding chaperone